MQPAAITPHNLPSAQAVDLIYGRWRSQALHAGAVLQVFDRLSLGRPKPAEAVAAELEVDSALLYRLMRALASLGLMIEDDTRGFALNEIGALFRVDHPQSLRDRLLVAECPEHMAIWKHLPDMIRDGRQDGFVREFGMPAFEYAQHNAGYRRTFDRGMSGYSAAQSGRVIEALRDYDFSGLRTVCDVGGGQGHLICALLDQHPHLVGVVLDLPEVFADATELWATKTGLDNRCSYVPGDMFKQAPAADVYTLKLILHDWSDQECIAILTNLRRAASDDGRIFIIERIVPAPHEPHFAKLFDVQMMCWGAGRERTEPEYARLLDAAGWRHVGNHYPGDRAIGIVEGRLAD